MAKFEPVNPPAYVFDRDGNAIRVFGWTSVDDWATAEPFVGNPDGPGAGPWHRFYGEDPWTLK